MKDISAYIQQDVDLLPYNTFGIAATAKTYIKIVHPAFLRRLALGAEDAYLILGGGSNIIFAHTPVACVLHMQTRGMAVVGEDASHIYVRAAAGASWHGLVAWTLAQGWGGLENLSLIPGSVGAAPVQNIGAYGVELADVLHSVTVFDLVTKNFYCMDKACCDLAYRDSIFKKPAGHGKIIVALTLALPKNWQPRIAYAELARSLHDQKIQAPTPHDISRSVIALRSKKLPDEKLGNVGSFFKNPCILLNQAQAIREKFPELPVYSAMPGYSKLSAAWMIEACGWKAQQNAGVGVYAHHALVLVNHGGATGAAVMAFAQKIQADVWKKFGITLDIEPTVL